MTFSPSDGDARMHRIINQAKFEVEEIQRCQRQNEADADSLDKELEKLRVEGEKIESEIGQLRAQTAQYEAEYDRATRVLQGAEDEKKLLDGTLRQKKEALRDFNRQMEEDDRAHEEMMWTYREKFARSNQGWEKLPHIRELREWEKKRDEDRRKVEELRSEKADVVERMERKKCVEARMNEFRSAKEWWICLAEEGSEHERLREHVGRKREELAGKKDRVDELKMEIAKEKAAAAAEEAARKEMEEAAVRCREGLRGQRQQQQQHRNKSSASSGRVKPSKKGRDKCGGMEDMSRKSKDISSRSTPAPSLMGPPSFVGGRALAGPISTPREEANPVAPRSSTLMRTPQLNIPSCLKIKTKDGAAAAFVAPPLATPAVPSFAEPAALFDKYLEASDFAATAPTVAQTVSAARAEVTPSLYDTPETTATSEEARPVGEISEADDSFVLDLSMDVLRDDQGEGISGSGDLSFNMDFAEPQDGNDDQAYFFGGGSGDDDAANFSFDF